MGRGGWVGRWGGLCAGWLLAGCGSPPGVPESRTPSERGAPADSAEERTFAPPVSVMPPHPAPVRWQSVAFGWSPVSVATDSSGHVYTLSLEELPVSPQSPGAPLVLTMSDASGGELWRRYLEVPGSPLQLNAQSLTVSREGELFLAYSVPCQVAHWPCHPARYPLPTGGTSEATGAVLVKLSSTGEPRWVRSREQSLTLGLGMDSTGTAILLTRDELGPLAELRWYQPEGTLLREKTLEGVTALGLDSSDQLLLGSEGPRLSKWSPQGVLLWMRDLQGPGDGGTVDSVGTGAGGAVVATGSFRGERYWGTDRLVGGTDAGGTFLLVAEADGRPRWGLTTSSEASGTRVLAVDPSDQVVLATSPSKGGRQSALDKYTLGGEWLWHRDLGTSEYCVDTGARSTVSSLAISPGHEVIVGGVHEGLAKLGARCVTGNAGFVQGLEP